MSNRVPKEVTVERERRAWALRQKFKTEQEIATELGITQQAVSLILKRVEKRVTDQLDADVEHYKVMQTAQLEHIAAEAYQAWERSKLDAERETTTTGGKDGNKTTVTREGQCGDPRFLDQVQKAMADIRSIWGLNAPQRQDMTTNGKPMTGIDLMGLSQLSDEELDRRIAEAEKREAARKRL